MPIRFRCAYCNQLMAIARRKAGTVVRCPKCHGEIVVPAPEDMPPAPNAPANVVFEDRDFEKDFELPALPPAPSLPRPEAGTAVEPAPPPPPLLPPTPAGPRNGLFLSTPALIIFLATLLILLVLAFVMGLIVGVSWGRADAPGADAALRPDAWARADDGSAGGTGGC